MNRTILDTIKSPATLLFIGGFAVAVLAFFIKETVFYPLKATCISPVSFYSIDHDDNWALTRGVYRTYREGLSEGRIVYIGTLTHFQKDIPKEYPIPILREVRFEGALKGNLLRITVTGQNRRLGDQSSDEQVIKYVFPHIAAGDVYTSALYSLDGKAVATGTEAAPRVMCIN